MRTQYYLLALLLLSICFTVGCQRQGSAPANNTERTLKLTSNAPSPQESVNPIFAVTQDQLHKAFDEYETKGENGQQVSVDEKQTLNVSVQDSHGSETLKLTILFLPPLEQARQKGYEFGLVAKHRTPADRKDFEEVSVKTIMQGSNDVTFRVWLDQPKDDNATIPTISYQLLDKDGQRINPTTQPGSYIFSGKDTIGDVALAEDGQPLIFPLNSGSTPNLTSKKNKMTLVVSVDGAESNHEFHLK